MLDDRAKNKIRNDLSFLLIVDAHQLEKNTVEKLTYANAIDKPVYVLANRRYPLPLGLIHQANVYAIEFYEGNHRSPTFKGAVHRLYMRRKRLQPYKYKEAV
jgi:hypothetical protein